MNVSQTDVGHRSEFLSLRRNAKDADKHVGQRIRERRIRMGQTLQQMADMIGVTYQQAHKYKSNFGGPSFRHCRSSGRRYWLFLRRFLDFRPPWSFGSAAPMP